MRAVKILEPFGKIRAFYWSCAGLWFSTTQVSARLDNCCCRVGFCFRVSRLPPNCGASFSCFGACKSWELFPASSMTINTSFASLQHRDSLATCTAVCAAWRYTHATKMFGMANQSPLALACRMTPLLCSVRCSVRDQEARAAHEVNGMGQPAPTLPRWDMRSSDSRGCRILSRPGVQGTACACAATRNHCTAARNVRW
jgi:hypothetical protein